MALILLFIFPWPARAAMAQQEASQPAATRPEKGVFSRNWRGMLVDFVCGSSSADRSAEPEAAPPPFGPNVPHLTLQDWEACPATARSTEFVLVFYSGRAVRLDNRSNALVAAELARRPKWTARAGPPLARIKGTLYGEVLQVESMEPIKKLR
jgi:hypothetical protein